MRDQGTPLGINRFVRGLFWAKWPKTARKLQNQHFRCKTVGKHCGDNSGLWVVGELTRGNPASM